jgi:hypothetical protein
VVNRSRSCSTTKLDFACSISGGLILEQPA